MTFCAPDPHLRPQGQERKTATEGSYCARPLGEWFSTGLSCLSIIAKLFIDYRKIGTIFVFGTGVSLKTSIMKLSNQRGIKTVSLIALAIGAIYLVYVYVFAVNALWIDGTPNHIVWSETMKGWQIAVMSGYVLGWTAVFVMSLIIEINILRGLKSGDLFPKKNNVLIMVTAALLFITLFFDENVSDVLKGVECSVLNSNCIFIPLIIIVFGLLYKQASLAMEDSNLAI
jgi:hypothetical protein